MRRSALAAALLAAAASLSFAPPASACVGSPCDEINAVCRLVLRTYCLR